MCALGVQRLPLPRATPRLCVLICTWVCLIRCARTLVCNVFSRRAIFAPASHSASCCVCVCLYVCVSDRGYARPLVCSVFSRRSTFASASHNASCCVCMCLCMCVCLIGGIRDLRCVMYSLGVQCLPPPRTTPLVCVYLYVCESDRVCETFGM